MVLVKRLMQPELREKVTSVILDILAHLPEVQKKIFVWKHYCGWRVEDIADRLQCSKAEVENTLGHIHSALLQRAGTLLV
jgi:DNA-directed RNA polymerase specialized sigma24 family protein